MKTRSSLGIGIGQLREPHSQPHLAQPLLNPPQTSNFQRHLQWVLYRNHNPSTSTQQTILSQLNARG